MEILCTRPNCPRPRNFFSDLDDATKLKTIQGKYCTSCGMPLILAGRYLPLRLLGRGGFGAAFLARDRHTPAMRECVVKQFQPAGNLTPQELAVAQSLFEREAEVLEQLGNKHPQIPDLFAFFPLIVPSSTSNQEEQYFYLVQEYIDGQDLETLLANQGTFSEAEVTEILIEILKILQFVHQKNSIHRDIKPSNIMRDRSRVLYLLDFGAVKQVAANANNPTPGKSTGIYSMGFAPPEQMAGAQVYPSTDLYALAATCINLLTGKPAGQMYDYYKNCWQWQDYAPQTSDRLTKILNRMLLPTPSERFQSATEVLEALNTLSIIQNQPKFNQPQAITPQPPTPPPPISSKPKRQIQLSLPQFSLLEILASAAFTGFEGALLYIALTSLATFNLSSNIIIGIWGMILGGLIFAQLRRIIEKVDLLIIAGISAAIIYFIPLLQGYLAIQSIFMIGVMAAAGVMGVVAVFRLIYQLLSRLL
ncbi:serine/threonine protein kinase [Stanieria cyanosphaera PCC 7437]|uniref:non-specific serine/threonine protein kinase n=1 Tax=Stanieria cyanosphaera (strain ATCC 29371 / PCC 7437) TaxID=111780 RepID=K9XNW1_STAC7|nr:serine/threonine-protein kinase [Stanieria cyanosphaera]AFZ33731.1 serine/threonine protein kinase [Stanieria cyanosphaera PCC 7437]